MRGMLVAVLFLAGCPAGGARTAGGGTPAPAALTIPPAAGASAELDRLWRAAQAGDVDAAWTRAHYLLDLFDDARFRRADDSLELLRAATEVPAAAPRRGRAATDDAIARLLIEVDLVLAKERRHAAAQQARILLEGDQMKAPASRAELRQWIIELRAVAAGRTLASNARLRLHGICRAALGDAVRMRWADRPQAIAYCLYPLYAADPEPYFDADPLRRPPAPRPRELTRALAELGRQVAGSGDRLAPAGRHVAGELDRFLQTSAAELPEPVEPGPLGLPRAGHAARYDGTPVIAVRARDPLATVDEYAGMVDAQLQGDGRGTVALAIAEAADLEVFRRAAAGAASAGARWIEIVYGLRQGLAVPEGDYWHGRLAGTAWIPGVVPVSLSTAAPAAQSDPRRPPHAPPWDPQRAALGLHLVVDAGGWRLVGPGGQVASIPTGGPGGDRGTELRVSLGRVRGAFAGESGLVLVAAPGATWASLAEAVQLAARDVRGQPLFDRLALGSAAPQPIGPQTLAQRIERRFRARVTIAPEGFDSRVAVVRDCYQELLEKRPELGGTVTVGGAGARGDAALRECALRGVEAMMRERKVGSVTVTMAPR